MQVKLNTNAIRILQIYSTHAIQNNIRYAFTRKQSLKETKFLPTFDKQSILTSALYQYSVNTKIQYKFTSFKILAHCQFKCNTHMKWKELQEPTQSQYSCNSENTSEPTRVDQSYSQILTTQGKIEFRNLSGKTQYFGHSNPPKKLQAGHNIVPWWYLNCFDAKFKLVGWNPKNKRN